MTHKGTITLKTERLILRRFAPEDAAAMFRNLPSKAGDTVAAVEAFFRTSWLEAYESTDSYRWVIELKVLAEPIGTVKTDRVDDAHRSLELGYEIGERWWHQGIMTEAVRRVIQFFFEEVGLNRIAARHNATNPRSGGVMINAGMSLEGVQRQASRTGCDVLCYAILAEDYFGKSVVQASPSLPEQIRRKDAPPMAIEQEMFHRAVELIDKRFPLGRGGAAVMHTADGQYLTSVALETVDSNVELCVEVGAMCEATKYDLKITHSLCVVRENEHSPCKILSPCGICQERLRYWGTDVMVGVTTAKNTLKFVPLSHLQPYHWTTAFDDIIMYDNLHPAKG